MKKIDKIIDVLSREYLLECINASAYKNNIGLYYFIQYEAKYEQVALAAFYKDFKVLEEDAEQSRKLDVLRKKLEPILKIGFSILAGGMARKAMGGAAATGFLSGVGIIGSGILAGAGIALLSKVLFAMMKIANDKCRKDCKKKLEEGGFARRLKLTICASTCKLKEILNLVRDLRVEISKCNKTKNPEKCKAILMKKVGQYNESVGREKKRLMKKKQKLKEIESDNRMKKPVSMTDKLPEVV